MKMLTLLYFGDLGKKRNVMKKDLQIDILWIVSLLIFTGCSEAIRGAVTEPFPVSEVSVYICTVMQEDAERSMLDVEYENEMKDSSGVTSEIIEITMKYAEVWKQEMEKYHDLLYDMLDDDGKSCLENSQEAWEEYSNSNKELVFHVEEQRFGGGSYLNILAADLLCQKYRMRALEMRELYESL